MPTISETIKKIEDFGNLPEGWRFGRGGAISQEKISEAISIMECAEAQDIVRANAFAGEDGELLLSFYIDDCAIDLTLESDGSLTYAEDKGNEQIKFVENLVLDDAYDLICQFSLNLNTFESFTQEITIQKAVSLKASLSNHPLRIKESRLSRPLVRSRIVRVYASTLPRSIQTKQGFPKSTGIYLTRQSRRSVA